MLDRQLYPIDPKLSFQRMGGILTCDDCGKDSLLKACEAHNPKGARICKDCCIVKMNGHKCRWWDLCWV